MVSKDDFLSSGSNLGDGKGSLEEDWLLISDSAGAGSKSLETRSSTASVNCSRGSVPLSKPSCSFSSLNLVPGEKKKSLINP